MNGGEVVKKLADLALVGLYLKSRFLHKGSSWLANIMGVEGLSEEAVWVKRVIRPKGQGGFQV